MEYHFRAQLAKREIREYRRAFREKNKLAKRSSRYSAKYAEEERIVLSQQQIFESALKRLHILGSQKFGSSPFREHFDRWLLTVETVLDEFEAQLDVNVDEQFVEERKQVLAVVKLQLEEHRDREVSLERRINDLSNVKNQLQHVNDEYSVKTLILKSQKVAVLKRLSKELEVLKKEQNQIIKLKTGFFRGISKKEREQREKWVIQRYSAKQSEFETKVLAFKEEQKRLREEIESKREPLLEERRIYQKCVKEIDNDCSLEERWRACERLRDAINNFFQRKSIKQA